MLSFIYCFVIGFTIFSPETILVIMFAIEILFCFVAAIIYKNKEYFRIGLGILLYSILAVLAFLLIFFIAFGIASFF